MHKKNGSKALSGLLVALALILVAVGCTSKTDNASSSQPQASQQTNAGNDQAAEGTAVADQDKYAPIEGKKYEISWTYYQLAPLADNAIMKKYFEDLFNVSINVMNVDYNSSEQILNLKVAGGEIPDKLNVISDAQKINFFNQGVAVGIPLDVVRTYAPNMMRELEENLPADILDSCCIRDGNLIAIPQLGKPMFRDPIVWRGDWLNNVGITKVPETLEQFEDAIYKFTKNDPDGNNRNDTYGLSKSGFSAVFGAFGIPWDFQVTTNWIVKDNQLVYAPIQPEAKEALALLGKWYKDGVIDPEFITGENTGGYWALSHAFINNRIGFTSHGQTYHWSPRMTKSADAVPGQDIAEMEKLNPEGAASIVHGDAPIGPSGVRGVFSNPLVTQGGNMFGKGLADEPDKAGKLLQMLDYPYQSLDNMNTALNGIKDEMWAYQEVETIFGNTEKTAVPIGQYVEWKGTDKLNTNFAHTAMLPFTVTDKDSATYQWHAQIKGDQFHLANELLAPLPSEAKFKAELSKIQDQAYISIITGEKPVAYFDEFVKQWRAAGGAELEKEAAEWYASTR